jgi:hypothetical protein
MQLRDHLNETNPDFELSLPHLKAPWHLVSVEAAETRLRNTTDQNQVAIALNAFQSGMSALSPRRLRC